MSVTKMLKAIELNQPFQGFDAAKLGPDLQGWGSDHPYFKALVSELKPSVIVEVGTWKGASAINMATAAKALRRDVIVLCVDTWLGSNEVLWSDPKLRPLLRLENGRPRVYEQFLANVAHSGLKDTIYPLPMTSSCAAELLQRFSIEADLIYIDAGHRAYEVYGDLTDYWPLVRKGGIMFGDDYWSSWPGVIEAVNRFGYEHKLPLEITAGKFMMRKA